MRFLFSNEKLFDINGVYNSQNERIWPPNRTEADAKDGTKELQKVMVWLEVYSKRVCPLMIFEERTVDHDEVLVSTKFGRDMFENN